MGLPLWPPGLVTAPLSTSVPLCPLRSVLEPGRSLTLAEKGGAGAELVVAHPAFRIVATMNPGGDYGKKELSPALSNRFTSIWVPAIEDMAELLAILESRLAGGVLPVAGRCMPGPLP